MIATWMLSALIFTALVAGAAWCAESALRAVRRPTRWPWLVALAAAVAWPVIAPFARRLLPTTAPMTRATLPGISVSAQLPAAMLVSWIARLDTVLLVLWVVASGIVILRLVRALLILAQVRRASRHEVIDGIPVLVSDSIGPAVVGVVQPSVLLPTALLALEEPLRRLILRHEDEHRRAHDPLIVLSSAIAVALVPWNAPLWWITRRARLALEVDCDARVLSGNANAAQYGKLLLLISQRQTMTHFAPMLAAHNSHLERRIDAMLPTRSKSRRMKFVAAVLGTIVVGIAACTSRIGDIAGPKPSASISRGPVQIGENTPYRDYQVEKTVRQLPATGNLRYPDILRAANVEGEVLAQFVVGVDGKYEDGTFKALRSDHELFTQAVKSAMPTITFTPALVGGKPVRQLVQQPFSFSLSKDAYIGPSVAHAPGLVASTSGTKMPTRVEPVAPRKAGGMAALATPAPVAQDAPMREFQVNKTATQVPGTGNLRYPDMLRSANVEGEVIAQFVVNADGTIDTDSFKVLKSSHELFTQAVKAALPDMRFAPAEVEGKKVKQLIQTPFTFSLSK